MTNEGRIPARIQFAVKKTCPELHPGVCATELSADVRRASVSLIKAVRGVPPGAVFRLEVTAADGAIHFLYRMVSVTDEQSAVLLDCFVAGGRVALRMTDSGLVCQMAERVMLDAWEVARNAVGRIMFLRIKALAPKSMAEARRPLPLYELPPAGLPETLLLWPVPVVVAPPVDPGGAGPDVMAAGLKLVHDGLKGPHCPGPDDDVASVGSSSSEDGGVIAKLAADLENTQESCCESQSRKTVEAESKDCVRQGAAQEGEAGTAG